jgi:hypothetical protein
MLLLKPQVNDLRGAHRRVYRLLCFTATPPQQEAVGAASVAGTFDHDPAASCAITEKV